MDRAQRQVSVRYREAARQASGGMPLLPVLQFGHDDVRTDQQRAQRQEWEVLALQGGGGSGAGAVAPPSAPGLGSEGRVAGTHRLEAGLERHAGA